MAKEHHRTIVLSDIHLGSSGSKAREVVRFLKQHTCDLLILNGDIIDGWQLRKSGAWRRKHTRFLRAIIKHIEHHRTRVVYLRGNHDDFLDQVLPLRLGKHFYIQREMIYESMGRRYLVIHGDIFDSITSQMRWLARLGDVGYTFLLWINKLYNQWRVRRGLPYYSLSQRIKARVKQAVSYISDYEKELVALAEARKCDGIICGHIHQPAIRQYGAIEYLNSGDWVESLSALVEDDQGQWRLIYYEATEDELTGRTAEDHADGEDCDDYSNEEFSDETPDSSAIDPGEILEGLRFGGRRGGIPRFYQ